MGMEMVARSNEFCYLCEKQVMLCVPGTKAECGVFLEFQSNEERPVDEPISIKPVASITNTGIMNRLQGQIVDINQGQVMARTIIKVGENYISSIIPAEDFLKSGKQLGDTVSIAFTSFNVKLMV
jgi:hypothetical protein